MRLHTRVMLVLAAMAAALGARAQQTAPAGQALEGLAAQNHMALAKDGKAIAASDFRVMAAPATGLRAWLHLGSGKLRLAVRVPRGTPGATPDPQGNGAWITAAGLDGLVPVAIKVSSNGTLATGSDPGGAIQQCNACTVIGGLNGLQPVALKVGADGTVATSGGGGSFATLTGGTNTTAAMVVGTGASLTTSGTGTITATNCPSCPSNASSFLQIVDCSTYAGADLGAKLNACDAAAPYAAILSLLNFTEFQNVSTAVSITKNHQVWSCGIYIAQTASITLTGGDSGVAWVGCPNAISKFIKGANVDQFVLAGNRATLKYVYLYGTGYTGRGVYLPSGSNGYDFVDHNVILNEQYGIQDASTNSTITYNEITGSTVNAILTAGSGTIAFNSLLDATGTTGDLVRSTGQLNQFNDNFLDVTSTSAVAAINESGSFQINQIENNNIGVTNAANLGAIIGTAATESGIISGNQIQGYGVDALIYNAGKLITGNVVSGVSTAAPVLSVIYSSDELITDNQFYSKLVGTGNLGAVEFGDGLNNQVANNFISTAAGSSGGAATHFGIVLIDDNAGNETLTNSIHDNKITNSGNFSDAGGISLQYVNSPTGRMSANQIYNNTCVDMGPCVSTVNYVNTFTNGDYYSNNTANFGSYGYSYNFGGNGTFASPIGASASGNDAFAQSNVARPLYGTCVFAAGTTCSVTYGVPYSYFGTPVVTITPINPGAVTFTLTATSAAGFTITGSVPNSVTVNYSVSVQ